MTYNWQKEDWPNFRYDTSHIEDLILCFIEKTAHISGILKGLPDTTKTETIINLMVTEAIKTSEIEGEYLSRKDVMSSIHNQLGLNKEPERIKDKRAQGAAELMLAVRNSYTSPLDKETLFSWHSMLLKHAPDVKIGAWRTHNEPMQVISGALGKPKVHFEAPPSKEIPQEMKQFIHWFNSHTNDIKTAPIHSAIAHIYFETIHPFEDGNGRIGRALSEKALSQGINHPVILSLSQTIEKHKKDYYNALEQAQKSNEITEWITYFIQTILVAQEESETLITFILQKTKFFERYKKQLNKRQMKVIQRMLKEGPHKFTGGMSAKKYMTIAKTSKATATRDLHHLTDIGALTQSGIGRGTRYDINFK